VTARSKAWVLVAWILAQWVPIPLRAWWMSVLAFVLRCPV
jgi:hypothetical protein